MESGLKTLSPQKPQSKSPWRSPSHQTTPTCSLAAVMDEELAKTLQEEEEHFLRKQFESRMTSIATPTVNSDVDTSNDFALAQMLQLEYDREHDRQLVVEEQHFNKQSKVKISFEKFRSLPQSYLEDERSDCEDDNDDDFEEYYQKRVSPPKSGRRKGVAPGQPTKHDAIMCGQRNVQNMEKFPPDFPMGDIQRTNPDLHLQNKVFNSLKEHSLREEKSSHRLHESKEHSTQEHVLDPKTRLMLFKLVDNGRLNEVNGCISTGKEAAVFHAIGGELEDGTAMPTECAIKIFKTSLNEFFRRDKYIKDDYRFKSRFNKQNPRKIVRMWAEKEMHNLKRLHSHGVPCPEVVLLRKHVLIMSFIGKDNCPAPKLKDSNLSAEQLKSAYHQCVQIMERMYKECHLVHADLNEYNMLWFEGRVYIIDVSQSVEPSHPHGLEFLLRDCQNITNFFSKQDIPDLLSHQDLFNKITGLNIMAVSDQEFIAQIRTHTQRQQLLDVIYDKNQPYPFDYFFEETTKNKLSLPTKETQRGLEEEDTSSSDEENT